MTFPHSGRSGYYAFENLCQDGYIVQAAPSNFSSEGVLNGYFSSTGAAAPEYGVISEAIHLDPLAGSASADFGFYHPESEPVTDTEEEPPFKPF
jgi:hypothetical protein